MSNPVADPLAAFVEHVTQQLTKHGFPERQVSFPIERMYESAAAKGLSFNKVLEVLAARGIAHEKTPEKVIFSLAAPEDLMAAAQAAMQQMSPEQLAALRGMLESMTPEEQAEMMEQAKKLGLG